MTRSSRKPLLAAWLWAAVLASAMCSGYLAMYGFRRVWQAHYPQLAEQWANNGSFAVIGWYGTELGYEELMYAARTNDAAQHWRSYDPFVRDNRTLRQFFVDKLDYLLMGAVQHVVREINWTWIIVRFACCLAWFILIYHIIMRVAGSPPVAIGYAAFVTAFSYILTGLWVHALEWHGGWAQALLHDAWTMLSYGRTEGILRLPRPGVTYGLLFAATLALIEAAERPSWRWAAASGLLGGALAYSHLDSWSIYMAGAGIVVGASWFLDRGNAWRLAASFGLSVLTSLPYVYANYPPNRELILRGTFTPNVPPGIEWYTLVYCAAFLLVLRYRRRPAELVLGAMALGTCIALHAVAFSAHCRFAPENWEFIGNIYLFLLTAAFLSGRARECGRPWLLGAGGLTAVAFLQSFSYAAIHFPFQGLPRDYSGALAWLERNTARDDEVLSLNPEVNLLIPAYTHDKISLAVAAPTASDYPLEKGMARLFGALRLLGVERDRFVRECLLTTVSGDERRGQVAEGLHRGTLEKNGALRTMMLYVTPEEYVRQTMQRAERLNGDPRPDYLWFGHLEREYAPKGFPGRDNSWREVYRNDSVSLYRRDAAR